MKTIFKKILKNLFFKNGIKRQISSIDIVFPYGFHNYYETDYEADNVKYFRTSVKNGNIVIDVGAQLGLMTKLFSDLVGENGRVHSFEPTPTTFALLNETVHLNHLSNVVTNQMAVCEVSGTAGFSISGIDADAGNTLSTDRSLNRKEITINTISIDDYMASKKTPKIDFIKIDAEGAEYLVLLGATSAMKNDRPFINLALHPISIKNMGHSLEQIYDLVQERGYKIMYLNTIIDKAEFCKEVNLFDVQLIPE